jgi:hypothetical protein
LAGSPLTQRHEVVSGLVKDVLILFESVGPLLVGSKFIRSLEAPGRARCFSRQPDLTKALDPWGRSSAEGDPEAGKENGGKRTEEGMQR